jgi:predicted AlkP superfamily pyrophosphatase or phosphodiesterase
MDRKTKHLVIISFDGLAGLDFDYIRELPNFSEYIKEASYCKNVYSIYPSVTYPAHATIVTGRYPKNHGVINNTLLQPHRSSPDWHWQRKYVKGKTLYDAAIDKGMKVAALLWPVTARSRIQYNMPEIFANRPWQNQVIVSLMNGSPIYQLELNKRFGHLRKGLRQPYLDDFVHMSALYTIKNKRPDITMIHYVDLDSMRHYYGFNSEEARQALNRHDKRLGEIIETLKENNIYEDSTIIILGDHSSLDENKIICLNVVLKDKGYIKLSENGRGIDYKAIVKSCDGSAYVYLKDKKDKKLAEEIYEVLEEFNKENSCMEAVYSSEEASRLGADPNCTFMLEARRGYYFTEEIRGESIKEVEKEEIGQKPHRTRATHGYSPFKENYTTVFMASGSGISKGEVIEEMRLVDEAPTIAELLGIKLEKIDGRIIKQFIK